MMDSTENTEIGKSFIGAVKFFDANKDFGYIASNNCNMSSPKYFQDFYIDSSSFIEEEAKKEGRIVVFKIKKENDGKKRAIQVRSITKSEEDIQLALTYYGDHEYIRYKDNKKINLYTKIYKPIKLVAEKVQAIIENDIERSPQKTIDHFTFFVNHYKKEASSEEKYIFDRDYSKEEKTIWIALFSIFTDDERLELLMQFPSAARYLSDCHLLLEWIDAYLSVDKSLSRLKEIERTFKYIPEECVIFAKERIEAIADVEVKRIYAELSTRSDICEVDLIDTSRQLIWDSYSYDSEAIDLLENLVSYKALTSKEYEEEIQSCVTAIRANCLKVKLTEFRSDPSNSYIRDSLFKYIDTLKKEELIKYKDDINEVVVSVIDEFIIKQKYQEVVSLLKISTLDDSIYNKYKDKLFPHITEILLKKLDSNLYNPYNITNVFFPSYESLTSIFDSSEKDRIKNLLLPDIIKANSLYVLSAITTSSHNWLSLEKSLNLAENIISNWQYSTFQKFVESEPELFDNNLRFVGLIIKKVVELIGEIPLKQFFDGSPVDNKPIAGYYLRNPQRENCTFLKKLKELIPKGQNCSEWELYISSRSVEDLVILFENDVIDSLPDSIIISLIDSITLDYIYDDYNHWYQKPSLKHPTYSKIFRMSKSDLVSLIGQRLCSLEWTNENIPLAIYLTELMNANKPSEDDYIVYRNWESNFNAGLEKLASSQSNNKLKVVLWAVYYQTKTSMSTFSDMFAFFPPYIQIRCVKKLFQLIGQGKIKQSAESLYNLLGNGTKKMCFPLEIALAYLKIREKDTNATLNNNVMLQLLEGRDDHKDWIGIRQMVTQCEGRCVTEELPDDYTNRKRNSYFNGVIKKINNNTIRVFIPYKMVDEYGTEKKYNNKYYHHSIEQIKVTYSEDEYNLTQMPQGSCYDFDISYEVELFSIARAYNFHYNGLNNFIGFKTKEEQGEIFCECRLANNLDNYWGISFYWCGNKPCFRIPIRYRLSHEWEQYTILDFMRILNISADYTNKAGNKTKFGHYIILSSYLKSFAKFYEHLSCRECGKLMKPKGITNFTTRAVTEFSCANEQCKEHGKTVYLNHCFNKKNCNATIDSRDSKTCPNDQYICPECGACCSTENFKLRIQHLRTTGGYISERLVKFVENDLGHWEKGIYFCYKCGKQMNERRECPDCNVKYDN